MNWYTKSMPTVKDIKPFINQICAEIKNISGVKDIYLYGSYADNINNAKFICKDIDLIAATEFDSGDLLAIDNSKYSALKIHPNDLEDEGFNPAAVAFTKKFLSYGQYQIDHWATSSDNKLLHWGAIPENKEDWQEIHIEAEHTANKTIGTTNRAGLAKKSEMQRKEWKDIYNRCVKKHLSTISTGWFASDANLDSVFEKAIKL